MKNSDIFINSYGRKIRFYLLTICRVASTSDVQHQMENFQDGDGECINLSWGFAISDAVARSKWKSMNINFIFHIFFCLCSVCFGKCQRRPYLRFDQFKDAASTLNSFQRVNSTGVLVPLHFVESSGISRNSENRSFSRMLGDVINIFLFRWFSRSPPFYARHD